MYNVKICEEFYRSMFTSFFHFSRRILLLLIFLLKPQLDYNGGFELSTFNLSLNLCKQVLSISDLIKTEILADSKLKFRKKSWG